MWSLIPPQPSPWMWELDHECGTGLINGKQSLAEVMGHHFQDHVVKTLQLPSWSGTVSQCPRPQFLSFPPFLLADLLPPSLLLSLFTVGAISCLLMSRGPYSEDQKACHQSLEWPLKQILTRQSLKMTAAQLLTMTVSWLQTRARAPQVSCSQIPDLCENNKCLFFFKLLSLGKIYHAAINN